MKIISFWYDCDSAKSNYYEKCYNNLKKQLNYYNYDFYIENIQIDNPNYKTINFHKPYFIKKCLAEFQQPVLWIDIDCQILKPIDELKTIDCDVGLFMRDKRYDYGQSHYEIGTPHACLMYFNNTKDSIDFVTPWETICENAKNDPSIRETEHAYLINYYRNISINFKLCKFENYCTSNINEIHGHKIFVGISQGGVNYDNGMCGWENIS
jgi:hypothetical protein